MKMDQYQAMAMKTAVFPKQRGLVYCSVALSGEVGEFCNTLKKHLRGDDKGQPPTALYTKYGGETLTEERRQKLLKEYRGALWYMAALAELLGTRMSDQAELNLQELAERKKRGTLQGTGDDR